MLGLNQAEVGDLLGISRATINRWEVGATTPRAVDVNRVMSTLVDYAIHQKLTLAKRKDVLETLCDGGGEKAELVLEYYTDFIHQCQVEVEILLRAALTCGEAKMDAVVWTRLLEIPVRVLKKFPFEDRSNTALTGNDVGLAIEAAVRGKSPKSADFDEWRRIAWKFADLRFRHEVELRWQQIEGLVRTIPHTPEGLPDVETVIGAVASRVNPPTKPAPTRSKKKVK